MGSETNPKNNFMSKFSTYSETSRLIVKCMREPSLRVHLMSPDCLDTACRLPSSVDTNRRDSGSVTDFTPPT